MLNRVRFYELKKIVKNFKKEVDKVSGQYQNEVKNLEESKGKYTAEYIQKRRNEALNRARTLTEVNRKMARHKASLVWEGLRNDVDTWVAEPVDNNFLQRLNVIKDTGLQLSPQEAQILADSAKGNYMAGRLLHTFAQPETSNNSVDVFAFYDGGDVRQPPTSPRENPLAMMNIREPKVEDLSGDITKLKGSVDVIFDYYTGSNMCTDLIEGDLMQVGAYVSAALNDVNAPIDNLVGGWRDIMLKSDSKVTPDEKQWIDSSFEGCLGVFDKKQTAAKLIAETPEVKELLQSSDYAEYVK